MTFARPSQSGATSRHGVDVAVLQDRFIAWLELTEDEKKRGGYPVTARHWAQQNGMNETEISRWKAQTERGGFDSRWRAHRRTKTEDLPAYTAFQETHLAGQKVPAMAPSTGFLDDYSDEAVSPGKRRMMGTSSPDGPSLAESVAAKATLTDLADEQLWGRAFRQVLLEAAMGDPDAVKQAMMPGLAKPMMERLLSRTETDFPGISDEDLIDRFLDAVDPAALAMRLLVRGWNR